MPWPRVDDVNKILTGIAERNKMTLEQFTQHMKGMGAKHQHHARPVQNRNLTERSRAAEIRSSGYDHRA